MREKGREGRKEGKQGQREGGKQGGREEGRKKNCFFPLEALKSLPDRLSAVSQPLKVANPLACGKWSLWIVLKSLFIQNISAFGIVSYVSMGSGVVAESASCTLS